MWTPADFAELGLRSASATARRDSTTPGSDTSMIVSHRERGKPNGQNHDNCVFAIKMDPALDLHRAYVFSCGPRKMADESGRTDSQRAGISLVLDEQHARDEAFYQVGFESAWALQEMKEYQRKSDILRNLPFEDSARRQNDEYGRVVSVYYEFFLLKVGNNLRHDPLNDAGPRLLEKMQSLSRQLQWKPEDRWKRAYPMLDVADLAEGAPWSWERTCKLLSAVKERIRHSTEATAYAK
jgi:hypothetical protein